MNLYLRNILLILYIPYTMYFSLGSEHLIHYPILTPKLPYLDPLLFSSLYSFLHHVKYVPELQLSSCTSSTSQDLRPDHSVIEKSHDSSRNAGSTVRLRSTQLNSTRLSCSGAGPLVILVLCFTFNCFCGYVKLKIDIK